MRSPSNESLPGLQQPHYGTRSRYRENARNDYGGITTCPQEGNIEEIHSPSVKIKDLGSCLVTDSINMKKTSSISLMRSPSNESLPGLQQPHYGTRSRYRENARNDYGGITTCPQEGNLEDIHSRSVKIKDLGSCLVTNSSNMPLGVQNSDDFQNIQKSASFMCKNRDVDFQNIRKSPRLSVQNRRDKHVFESNQEGVKCRSNSQIEGLDRNKLCVPAEVISAKSQQSQDRSVEYEGVTDLQNVHKSPRSSGESRESDLQLLFESTKKVINCRRKSRKKDLNQEKLFSPSEVKFGNMAQVHNRSSNGGVSGLQSIVDSSNKGACTHESHIKSTCKSNLSLKTKAAPTSMPQVLNTGVNCDGIMDSQSIRKSLRLSGKDGELDLQKKDLPTKFSFATDVELTTVTQVQNMSSDCDQGTDLKTMQKSLQLSGRSRETNLDSNIGCSEKGRTEPQKNGSDLNTLSAVKVFDKPQVQNVSANSNGQMDLKNMRKSPRLSGMKRQPDLQICTRKEVKLGAESQKKACHGNNLSLPSKVKLTNAPPAQNQTANSNNEVINLGTKSQKKVFDGSNMSSPVEVELTSATPLHNENVNADGWLLKKAIASPLNSSKSLPSFEYYVSSGKGINLIVDLNSSPDWTKKIFETWSSSQSLQMKKFESFRHEIESLRSKKMISPLISTSNSSNKITPSPIQINDCPKSVSGETCPLRSYIPDRGNGSSDITETNSCIDARTRDGHLDNSSDVNTETSGDHIPSFKEFLQTRISVSGTKASEQSSKRPVNAVPDGSHKRKTRGRKICGITLKSGKHLGSRKSMRLSYKGTCQKWMERTVRTRKVTPSQREVFGDSGGLFRLADLYGVKQWATP